MEALRAQGIVVLHKGHENIYSLRKSLEKNILKSKSMAQS